MIEKPEITIEQLRATDSDTAKLFDVILKGLVEKHWEDKSFRDLGIGLEGSLEAFEDLIDGGILKLGCDEEQEAFFFMKYDYEKNDYFSVGT